MKRKLLLAGAIMLSLASCQKDEFNKTSSAPSDAALKEMILENGNNPDETVLNDANRTSVFSEGYVYIQSNDANQNAVLNYAQDHRTGSLTLEQTVMSGGKGAGGGLGSQGAVALSKDHHWLFAVNAGSNSISSFKVDAEGDITLSHTVNSQGKFPVSVCVYENLVYVVNQVSSNIAGFKLDNDGNLTFITNSKQKLSVPNAIPAQIAFAPFGGSVIVSERFGNTISTFAVDASTGAAGTGIFTPSAGDEPFGFDFSRDKYMIVSNTAFATANLGSCTSYEGFLHPKAVNGVVPNYQTATCWVSTTNDGRYAFTTNTQSNNITSYYVNSNGSVYFLSWSIINTGNTPIDLKVSGDNRFVYCINSMSHTISKFKRGAYGTLSDIGKVNIPPYAAGMAAY